MGSGVIEGIITALAISGDGSRLAYKSLAADLVPGDTNARDDIWRSTTELTGRCQMWG